MNIRKVIKATATSGILCFAMLSTAQAATVSLITDKTNSNYILGELIKVTISVTDYALGGTTGGGVVVGFDPTALTAAPDAVAIDTVLWNFGSSSTISANSIDVSVAGFPGATGTAFDLAVITFTAAAVGNFTLSLAELASNPFFTAGGAPANPFFNGVSVSVSAVPLPPAIWLLGSALVGLVGMGRRKMIAAA